MAVKIKYIRCWVFKLWNHLKRLSSTKKINKSASPFLTSIFTNTLMATQATRINARHFQTYNAILIKFFTFSIFPLWYSILNGGSGLTLSPFIDLHHLHPHQLKLSRFVYKLISKLKKLPTRSVGKACIFTTCFITTKYPERQLHFIIKVSNICLTWKYYRCEFFSCSNNKKL